MKPLNFGERQFARLALQILMNVTAKAFGQKPLRIWNRPYAQALTAYAACTRDWMRQNTKTSIALQDDMYREAMRLGRLLHRLPFFRNDTARSWLVFTLYRCIGIDMSGELPGEVRITECFFSRYYTPEMCALIAAMDDGIVSGIMGDGKLTFTQRIT